jgi:hypothetical protein
MAEAEQLEEQEVRAKFNFEYVTSAVSLLSGDGIVVHVVNDSSAVENTRAVIYHNTGAGASTVVDSGSVVAATWTWSLGYTVTTSGEYWLRIQTTSESLIPRASFERVRDGVWMPVVSYRPGDFAVFTLPRKRLW